MICFRNELRVVFNYSLVFFKEHIGCSINQNNFYEDCTAVTLEHASHTDVKHCSVRD